MPDYVELRPGQKISVQRDAGSLDAAFSSTIRHVSPVGVRIDQPARDGVSLDLRVGEDLMVLVDLSGRLYTFTTEVLQTGLPDDGLLVDRPHIVQQSERRQFFRLSLTIRPRYAAVIDPQGNERTRLEALMLDISGGGTQLRTKQTVQAGDRVRVVFPLGTDEVEADLYILSAHALEDDRNWAYRVNGRFLELPKQMQERIIRFIFRQQVDFMKRGVR